MAATFRECQSLQKDILKIHMTPKSNDSFDDLSALSKMYEMIPAQNLCDRLVRIYIDNFESTLRILHITTFLAACEELWTASKEGIVVNAETVLPQLTLTLVIASSLEDPTTVDNDKLDESFDVSRACYLVKRWLDSLRGKQRIKLSTIRTQTLLLLAHQTRLKRIEEVWSEAGALVRSAMAIGLHQNPAEYPDLSVFEGEQRRRLWITIAEMDFQISMICGMPSMVRGAGFDWCIPLNVNDEDLFEGMMTIPMGKSFNEWTDSLCQVTLAKSLQWRIEAIDTVNNISDEADYEKVLNYCGKTEDILRNLPTIVKYDHIADQPNDGPGRLFARILLDVYLRRVISYICQTITALGFREVPMACVRSSIIILSHQDAFDPNVADLDVIGSGKYWDLFYALCKNDIVQAALSVCSEIKAMGSLPPTRIGMPSEGRNKPHDHSNLSNNVGRVSAWTKASLTRTVENAINSLLRRAGKLGSDLKDPLCISIVLRSVRIHNFTGNKESWMREGAVAVIDGCLQSLRNSANTIHGVEEPGSNVMNTFSLEFNKCWLTGAKGLPSLSSPTAEITPHLNGRSISTPIALSHRPDYPIPDNPHGEGDHGFVSPSFPYTCVLSSHG